MPELCRFFGIIIRMQCGDHPPPHFHAVYGDARASIDIERLVVIKGSLPPRALGLVVEWASRYQDELRNAWSRAERLEVPGKIAPLE